MAPFVLDDARMEAAVADVAQRLERRRAHQWLEQLGRGYQWLDRPDEARAAYLEAAELFEQKMAETGRADAGRQLEAGICLLHAGSADAARGWFTRALEGASGLNVAALHYLLGDDERAIATAGASDDDGEKRDAIVFLARARLDGDAAMARSARGLLAPVLEAERLAPGESSGPSWAAWDVVGESFRLEAELRGRAVPSHRAMLVELGLRPASEEGGA